MQKKDDDSDEEMIEEIKKINAVLQEDEEPFLNPLLKQEYIKIASALSLNKLLDEKLRRLQNLLVNRLHECRQKLNEVQKSVAEEKIEPPETFNYTSCGKPYFKDKSNIPAPDNEDTILMSECNMYDFSEITPVLRWTVKDKRNLTKLLLKMSIEIRKKELISKIAKLKQEGKDTNPKILEKQVDAINREIMVLEKKTLKDVALPIDQDYDWEMVAKRLNKRHSALECKSQWKEFLHPTKKWDKNEHARLREIAHKHSYQDWEAIAKELNTGRTGYQCFVYYRTNISNTLPEKKWTKEEEEYLRRLVMYYKDGDYIPWGLVGSNMDNRSTAQIYNKYSRLMESKRRFLEEEDVVILSCYDKFGPNLRKMTEYLPCRSAAEIRVRYQILAKMRKSTVWSLNEDKRLLQLMVKERTISNYSAMKRCFPGKTRMHVRARYLTLIKWRKKYPNASLAHAPSRRLSQKQATYKLYKAVEKLKQRLETEVQKRKNKRITKEPPTEIMDDTIIGNFATEKVSVQEETKGELYEKNL